MGVWYSTCEALEGRHSPSRAPPGLPLRRAGLAQRQRAGREERARERALREAGSILEINAFVAAPLTCN